jgi:dephospho-CoA kinase
MAIRVFGLTGGIGSGKSTVAARFRERGLPVIDADQLARDVVARGSEGLRELVAFFGPDVLDGSGALDRKKVADLVFNDAAARERLNAITHPRVRELSLRHIGELDDAGEPLCCYEVPLLVESGLADALRPLVVVSVPEEIQIERTVARDGSSREHVSARVRAQLPLAKKVEVADYVIDSSTTREATREQADRVLDSICEKLGIDPLRYPRSG